MSWALRISAATLTGAILGGAVAGFNARAAEHPNLEPSLAAACAGCHMTDYRGARDHEGVKPTTCGTCHSQERWHERHFDHPFALSGKHEKASCFKCHTGDPPAFHGTPSGCYACHRAEYERAPFHAGHVAVTCHDCHGFEGWKPAAWPKEEEPLEPPPVPTVTAPEPTVTVTATTPRPPPTVTARPKPKPKPSATASAPTRVPDVVTRPSRHEE